MHLCLRRLGALLFLTSLVHAAEPVDPLRLTREVVPVAQSVELTLDLAKDDFSGRVLVDLQAAQAFTSFRLHAEGPVISQATLTASDGESIPLQVAVTNAKHGLVTMTAPRELGRGSYRLTAVFAAKFTRDGLGLYKTVSRGDPYLFTQFEDIHARKAFPCWDEPSFKIPWQVTLTVPGALEAVSNAAVAYETRAGEAKTIAFGRTPPMPSYLVALAVGPFEYVPVPGLAVPGRIITPKGQSALAAEAAKVAPPILARLEEYFGIPYPYAKLDQIAVPEYVYGAMENAGLITWVDRGLLLDSAKAPFTTRRWLATTTAHEMAHMWYGNLVTMAWWDDLWLNESTADWIAGRIVEHQYPEFRVKISESRGVKSAMRTDALPSVTAIRRKVTAETDLAQLADVLTYNKGKGILDMVENWIGSEQFRAAMRAYFIKHRWGNTVATDLWDAFSATSGDDITGMLAGFIEQPGVPLVSLALEPDGQLRLTQRRFNNLGDPQLPGQWRIPVILNWSRHGEMRRERILLTEATQLVRIPGLAEADWVYPNADESGYYRWNLSPELNARLARQAASLAPIERVGLLDNVSALFSAGLIDGNDYLAYVTAFGRDLDPDVNAGVAGSVNGLDNAFINDQSRAAYEAYRRAILRPILDRLGLQPKPDEPAPYGPLRVTLYGALGYAGADPEIVAECRRLATLCLENPAQVDPTLRGTALSVTAYHGDAAHLAALKTLLEKPQTPAFRSSLIGALGSFRDPALAREALAYSLTPAMNSTEFLRVVNGLAGTRELRELCVDWAMRNWDAIAAKAPPEYTAGLISLVGGAEPPLFNQFKAFLLDPARKTEFSEVNIAKATDRLNTRLRLREKEQANVVKFLETFSGQPAKD